MSDEIKAMTAELARDPGSLVFLKLGDALRARGQKEPAARIAASGVVRHPDLAAAHDLYARVLVDLGDFERAYHEWTVALELDPRQFGAHKGLGFLCYRWGDLEGAIEHLELALAGDPSDLSVVQAMEHVREGLAETPRVGEPPGTTLPEPPGPRPKRGRTAAARDDPSPWSGLEGGGERGVLLVDQRGLVLTGVVPSAEGRDVGEEVAAHLAGAAQEAQRTARLLEMGQWRSMLVEGGSGNLMIARPTPKTVLFLARAREVPQGRLGVLADRACRAARRWLEDQRL